MSMPLDPYSFTPYWPKGALSDAGLWRHEQAIDGYLPGGRVAFTNYPDMLLGGGYSYLGLNGDPHINAAAAAALERYGTGTCGVRLLAGSLALHRELEAALARFKQAEDCVVFSSGYAANLSLIPVLLTRRDCAVCDRLAHASLLEGCALSGAQLRRFAHNDLRALEDCLQRASGARRRLVIVDGVYSMDGDIADLPGIAALCREHDALLMVDEAHSIGVLGRTGRGIEEHFGLEPDCVDIKMGTLSKAIPASGGYVAGSRRLCEYLRLSARGYIYSGALAPASAAAALEALRIIEQEPQRVAQLHANIACFRRQLTAQGFDCPNTESAIFPVIVGDAWTAWRVAAWCQDNGLFVQAIAPPVVPPNSSRLRLAVTAAMSELEMDFMLEVLCASREAIDWTEKSGRFESSG